MLVLQDQEWLQIWRTVLVCNVDFMDGVNEFADLAQDVFNSW